MSRRTLIRPAPSATPWTCDVWGGYWHSLNETGDPVCVSCAMRPQVTPHPWLHHFPEAAWLDVQGFVGFYAAQDRTQTPAAVLERVERFLNGTLVWSLSPHKRELADAMLQALTAHRTEALAYAATFLPHKEPLCQ